MEDASVLNMGREPFWKKNLWNKKKKDEPGREAENEEDGNWKVNFKGEKEGKAVEKKKIRR